MSIKVDDVLADAKLQQQALDGKCTETPSQVPVSVAPTENYPHLPHKLGDAEPKSKTTTNSPRKNAIPLRAPKPAEKKPPVSSGIPKRLPKLTTNAPAAKTGGYRITAASTPGITTPINKNTLEMQFNNNRKRMLQMSAEIAEKQRPLFDIYKSLVRTQKQLESLGRKVVLEELKVHSVVGEEVATPKAVDEESPLRETAVNLKKAIDGVFETVVQTCQKCFKQCDSVVGLIEQVACTERDPQDVLTHETVELLRLKGALERNVETVINESEKIVVELLENLKNAPLGHEMSDVLKKQIEEMEAKMRQQEKNLAEYEENAANITRKYEEKKAHSEKQIAEYLDKCTKLEEELKKEKRNAGDNLMKTRNFRGKMLDFEQKLKDAEERNTDLSTKIKKLEEQLHKKEVQWVKEKDDFKKNEALLQQKFAEKQSIFDTRIQEITTEKIEADNHVNNMKRMMGTELEIKDHKLTDMEKEKEYLNERISQLESQVEQLHKDMEEKEKELTEISTKQEEQIQQQAPQQAIDQSDYERLSEYQKKIAVVQSTVKQQTEKITKMQNSLKAHAQLAVALKLEKDNAITYAQKLREVLQEARDEIELKNQTIYSVHEKMLSNESLLQRMKSQLYEQQSHHCHHAHVDHQLFEDHQAYMFEEPSDEYSAEEAGEGPQLVSGSLINMSVKKVDNLRARLDNLKKITAYGTYARRNRKRLGRSLTRRSSLSPKSESCLSKEIALKGKLYKILQSHADQSCEDFINLLKLTASSCGSNALGFGEGELKPSNCLDLKCVSSKVRITKSICSKMSEFNAKNVYRSKKSVLFEQDEDYC